MTNYWRLVRDIEIVQGKTWQAKFRYLSKCSSGRKPAPINLTGYTAKMVIREKATDSASMLELTTGSGITLGGTAGTIQADITATQAGTNLTAGTGVYEIELYNGATTIGFATGNATIYQEIVR